MNEYTFIMDDIRKVLSDIFEITGYDGDKEEFIKRYIAMIKEDAVYALIQSLPEQQFQSVAKKWDNNVDNPAALVSIINHNFKEEDIAREMKTAAEKAIQDYIRSAEKKLNATQKEKLITLSNQFGYALNKTSTSYRRLFYN